MKKEREYTIEDILALPDGERAELIDGVMYMMATPNITHQRLVGGIYRKIGNHLDLDHHSGCEVFVAPFADFLTADFRTYVEPDVLAVCDQNRLQEDGCHGAPDWVIEVVSPSSVRMDYQLKLYKYRTEGVREYWIVDPMKRLVTVFCFEKNEKKEYSFEEDVPSRICEGFTVRMAALLPPAKKAEE